LKPKILITGGSGFIGSALVKKLSYESSDLVVSSRKKLPDAFNVQQVTVSEINGQTDWSEALDGCDCVIHCAARVHVMNESARDPLALFREVNTIGTLALARQAAKAGVKRFVFLSSIKVNAETTKVNSPCREEVEQTPTDPYGLSKYEAEQGLLEIAQETAMEIVIIRSPLVYGPGVKGNFASMVKWIKKGAPLPLGAIDNRRSLIAIDNLVGFIIHCVACPEVANEVFLISDGEDVSTTELLKKVASAYGVKSCLLPVPVKLMRLVLELWGKGALAERLFGNLQVDCSKSHDLLGWKPVITMGEQLAQMAAMEKDENS
jgi:nucleoside-diphosphate-sugar epimerase